MASSCLIFLVVSLPAITLDEAVEAAKEAAAAWIDTALDDGMPIPPPSTLEVARRLRGFAGWAVGVIDLEDALFDDTIECINIALPRRVLRRLDDMARSTGQSRSGLVARLTVASSAKSVTPPGKRRVSQG